MINCVFCVFAFALLTCLIVLFVLLVCNLFVFCFDLFALDFYCFMFVVGLDGGLFVCLLVAFVF